MGFHVSVYLAVGSARPPAGKRPTGSSPGGSRRGASTTTRTARPVPSSRQCAPTSDQRRPQGHTDPDRAREPHLVGSLSGCRWVGCSHSAAPYAHPAVPTTLSTWLGAPAATVAAPVLPLWAACGPWSRNQGPHYPFSHSRRPRGSRKVGEVVGRHPGAAGCFLPADPVSPALGGHAAADVAGVGRPARWGSQRHGRRLTRVLL